MSLGQGDELGGLGAGCHLSGGCDARLGLCEAAGSSPGGWSHPLQKGSRTWAWGPWGPATGYEDSWAPNEPGGQSLVPKIWGRTLSSSAGPWAGKTGSVNVWTGDRGRGGTLVLAPCALECLEPPDCGILSSPPPPRNAHRRRHGRLQILPDKGKNGTEEGKSHAIQSPR